MIIRNALFTHTRHTLREVQLRHEGRATQAFLGTWSSFPALETLKVDFSAILSVDCVCSPREVVQSLRHTLPPTLKRLGLTENGPRSLRRVETMRNIGYLVREKAEAFPKLEALELVFTSEEILDDYGISLRALVEELRSICDRNGVSLSTSVSDRR